LDNIKKLLSEGRFPHAALIADAGSGVAFEAALAAAQALVCERAALGSERGEGCGECLPCRKVKSGLHPDVEVISGGEERERSFHVKSIRRLADGLELKPNEASRRVFILKDAQNMTPEAQNALLKSLEEPPRAVYFILTVKDPSSLLETVRSRCALFYAEGSEGAALDEKYRALAVMLVERLTSDSRGGLYGELAKALPARVEAAAFYRYAELALRDAAVYKACGSAGAEHLALLGPGEAALYASRTNLNDLLELAGRAAELRGGLSANANVRLGLSLMAGAL